MTHKLTLLILLAYSSLVITGCGDTGRIYKQYYILETIPSQTPAKDAFYGSLSVNPFSISPQFDASNFVYRTEASIYDLDYHNEFITSPQRNITDITRKYLVGSGLFATVLPNNYDTSAEFSLSANIDKFYIDFSDEFQPKAVVKMTFNLKAGQSILLDKTYTSTIASTNSQPVSLVTAYQLSLQNILDKLTKDLSVIMK